MVGSVRCKKVTKKFYEEYDVIFTSIKQFLAGQFDVPAKLFQKTDGEVDGKRKSSR